MDSLGSHTVNHSAITGNLSNVTNNHSTDMDSADTQDNTGDYSLSLLNKINLNLIKIAYFSF